MNIPYAELHAFPDGDRAHSGNPAGVARLEAFLPDADLLGLAQSNNLSETAFLVTRPEDADSWDLRWFTPGCEVDLCGHATLAAGVYLFEDGHVAGDTARFSTRSGWLEVSRADAAGFVMDFPAVPPKAQTTPRAGVPEALDAAAEAVFDLPQIHGSAYEMHVFPGEAEIEALTPDFGALARTGVNVLATAPGSSADIVSRFFCPAAGITEDPVTGSAHCTLAPYWTDRLGRTRLSARQIGPRPGALEIETAPGGRVKLYGTAARFLTGTIRFQ